MTDDQNHPIEPPIPGLGDLAPEPGPDYWARIDAGLSSIESQHTGGGGEGDAAANADHIPDDWDTDAPVIRLDDMNNFGNHNQRSILAIAAAALVLLVGGAFLINALSGNAEQEVDAANAVEDNFDADGGNEDGAAEGDPAEDSAVGDEDDTEDSDTEDSAADSQTDDQTDDADGPTQDDATDGEDDNTSSDGSTGAIPSTITCYEGIDFDGSTVVDVSDDGIVRSVESFNGKQILHNGRVTSGNLATMRELTSQTAPTQLWSISSSLFRGEGDPGSEVVDCGQLADVEDLLQTLSTIELPTFAPIQPVLAAGSTTCWAASAGAPGIGDDYVEISVQGDGTSVSLLSYGLSDGLIEVMREGTGEFVTDTEIAIDVSTWTLDSQEQQTSLYYLNGDGSLTIQYVGGSNVSVSCGELAAAARPGTAEFTIGIDNEIKFEVGASSGTLDDAVVGGTRNLHRFEANAGQTAEIIISSLENNGEFDLYGPDGEWILRQQTAIDLELPRSGVYTILVGSIRGNASYTLDLAIDGWAAGQ